MASSLFDCGIYAAASLAAEAIDEADRLAQATGSAGLLDGIGAKTVN